MVGWNSDGSPWWFQYSAGNRIISGSPAREVVMSNRSIGGLVSIHSDIVNSSFRVDQLFSLKDAYDSTTAAFGPS